MTKDEVIEEAQRRIKSLQSRIASLEAELHNADAELRQHATWWDEEGDKFRANEAHKAAENIYNLVGGKRAREAMKKIGELG